MSGTNLPLAKPPLPTERPRFSAGTVVGGRKVGGQYMSDSIISAAREGMVSQDQLDQAQKTIQDQQEQLNKVQKELNDQQQQLDQVQNAIQEQQPSRMQRLSSAVSRTVAPIRALGPMGVLRRINRAATAGTSLINFDLMDARRVAESTGIGYPRGAMAGGLGVGSERALFSMSRDMSSVRSILGRIENTVNKIAGDNQAASGIAPRAAGEEKKDSNWITALAAAGTALLGALASLRSGIESILRPLSELASLLGRTLVSAIASLFSPDGVVGRALISGARLLFSGPALAAIIGGGALAVIGSAIVRALQMSPEERAAAQMRAEQQAAEGVQRTEATPAGNPGQAAARGIARSYDIDTPSYRDIQDLLETPRQGETPEERARRESLDRIQRGLERNAPGGNVQLGAGVAEYIAERRAQRAEQDIAAGTRENLEMAQSINPADAFMQPEPQRAPTPAGDSQQRPAQAPNQQPLGQQIAGSRNNMIPADERTVMITSASRRPGSPDSRWVNLIENYAAMRRIQSPAGGVIQDGKVIAVLDRNRQRIDVTDLSRRDFSQAVGGDWEGTIQSPELATASTDTRAQTISNAANQPATVVVNNIAGGGQGAPAAAPAPASGGAVAVGRAPSQPTHPPRPSDVGSAALSGR